MEIIIRSMYIVVYIFSWFKLFWTSSIFFILQIMVIEFELVQKSLNQKQI